MSDTPTPADPAAEARKALAQILAAFGDRRLSYDDGITDDTTDPPEQGKPAALYLDGEWVADFDTPMMAKEKRDDIGRAIVAVFKRAPIVLAAYDAEHAARVAAEGEVARLRAGGCARDQRTTQFCAEAVDAIRERDTLRTRIAELERAAEEERARVTRIIRAQADAYLALHGGGGEYCHALSGALDSIYPTENT